MKHVTFGSLLCIITLSSCYLDRNEIIVTTRYFNNKTTFTVPVVPSQYTLTQVGSIGYTAEIPNVILNDFKLTQHLQSIGVDTVDSKKMNESIIEFAFDSLSLDVVNKQIAGANFSYYKNISFNMNAQAFASYTLTSNVPKPQTIWFQNAISLKDVFLSKGDKKLTVLLYTHDNSLPTNEYSVLLALRIKLVVKVPIKTN